MKPTSSKVQPETSVKKAFGAWLPVATLLPRYANGIWKESFKIQVEPASCVSCQPNRTKNDWNHKKPMNVGNFKHRQEVLH